MSDLRFLRELESEFERISEQQRSGGRRRLRVWLPTRAGNAAAFVATALSVAVVVAVVALAVATGHKTPGGASGSGLTSQPAVGPVPAGFTPVSVTGIDDRTWWLLGTAGPRCWSSSCLAIVRTTDGGRSFARIPAPPVPYDPEPSAQGPGVAAIHFADAHNGYAYDGSLYVTHNGGATWHQPHLPVAGRVVDLATAAGEVYAVVRVVIGAPGYLVRSPVGRDSWTAVPGTKYAGSVAAYGRDVYVTQTGSRAHILVSTDSGGHFNPTFHAPNAFGCSVQPEASSVIWVLCPRGQKTVLYRYPIPTTGQGMTELASVRESDSGGVFAVASPTTAVFGTGQLNRTDDSGAKFTRVRQPEFIGLYDLLFTDRSHGLALGTYYGPLPIQRHARYRPYPSTYLFQTTNAGRSYHQVVIPTNDWCPRFPAITDDPSTDLAGKANTEGRVDGVNAKWQRAILRLCPGVVSVGISTAAVYRAEQRNSSHLPPPPKPNYANFVIVVGVKSKKDLPHSPVFLYGVPLLFQVTPGVISLS